MGDMNVEYFYHCLSAENWSTNILGSTGNTYTVRWHKQGQAQYDYSCNCRSYRFGKPGAYCKHILEAKKLHCNWQQFTDGLEPVNGYCPKCNGPIICQGHAV